MSPCRCSQASIPANGSSPHKGLVWFEQKFLHLLTPITIIALLLTLVLLFSFKGEVITANPLTILWIAIPLAIQTILIFTITYVAAKLWGFSYENAAPSAMIGASNHFEVAIATAVMLFGLSSGAALATVVGVLIEVPLMLALVGFCKRTKGWFSGIATAEPSWISQADRPGSPIKIPSRDEIHVAFEKGESAIVDLIEQIRAQAGGQK